MTTQLQLPGDWPRNATWPDPLDHLRQLEHDKLDAKHEIRQVLDRYREKYRISARQVNQAVWGYVDDLLDDFFFEKEEALKAEIEEDIERENQRPRAGPTGGPSATCGRAEAVLPSTMELRSAAGPPHGLLLVRHRRVHRGNIFVLKRVSFHQRRR